MSPLAERLVQILKVLVGKGARNANALANSRGKNSPLRRFDRYPRTDPMQHVSTDRVISDISDPVFSGMSRRFKKPNPGLRCFLPGHPVCIFPAHVPNGTLPGGWSPWHRETIDSGLPCNPLSAPGWLPGLPKKFSARPPRGFQPLATRSGMTPPHPPREDAFES